MESFREPEAVDESYDRSLAWRIEMNRRKKEGKVLFRGQELPWRLTRLGYGKTYCSHLNWPEMGAPGWGIHCQSMQHYRRGKHTHQGGGIVIYCLEGRGRTVNNDIAMDWVKGDVEILPVTRTENSHEHFNLDEGKNCRYMAFSFWPFAEAVAKETRQVTDAPDWKGPKREDLYRPKDFVPQQAYLEGYPIKFDGTPTNLLDDLFLRRNKWRDYMSKARWLVKEKDQPLETNRMGIYRWFLHPSFDDVVFKALVVWIQEIPPGSRSGKQKFQGGRAHFVTEGHGYSMVNGIRYDWGPEDLLIPPIISGGVAVQHFNTDSAQPVKMVCAEPNWYETLGIDMACGFEQLEDCPEWQAMQK